MPPQPFQKKAARLGHAGKLLLALVTLLPFYIFDAFSQQPAPVNQVNMPLKEELLEESRVRRTPSPGRAAMLSASFPGLGQAYNGAYWKIPIIYAGFGAVAYAVNFNNTEYQHWRKAFVAKVDGNPNTIDNYPAYSDAALRRAMEFYRRNLELSYILGAALYLLNVLDANVQAHLMDFDVSPDLSLRVQPRVETVPTFAGPLGHAPGLKITFRF